MTHYRTSPDGKKYRQCEALVEDPDGSGDSRLCRLAAAKGDRLCTTHQKYRHHINRERWIITLSKKGVMPFKDKRNQWRYPTFVIGKVFNSYEDASLYTRLNSTLIFAIPRVKSYCIEPYRNVLK